MKYKIKKWKALAAALLCAAGLVFPVFANEDTSETEIEETEAESEETAEEDEEHEWDGVGDAGMSAISAGALSSQSNLENVTFYVDTGQTYTTEPYILYFCEIGTYQEYYVELYASENYTTKVKIPVGNYYFTSGGPENDYMSLYIVTSPESFTVYPDEENYVSVVVRSRGDTVSDTEDEEEEEEETEEEQPEEISELEKEKTKWYVYLFLAAAFLSIGIAICVTFYYNSEKENR